MNGISKESLLYRKRHRLYFYVRGSRFITSCLVVVVGGGGGGRGVVVVVVVVAVNKHSKDLNRIRSVSTNM